MNAPDARSMDAVALALQRCFGMIPTNLIPQCGLWYNEHFIATVGCATFHVKVYKVTPGYSVKERYHEVCFIHRVIRNLQSSGCDFVPLNLKTLDGDTVGLHENLIIDVSPHLVCRNMPTDATLLGLALTTLHSFLTKISCPPRPGKPSIRFGPIEDTLTQIRSRCLLWADICGASQFERRTMFTSLEKLEEWYLRLNECSSDSQLIHGDFSKDNVVIDSDGKFYILDFDCAYHDRRQVDIAHGMLSAGCDGYFSGRLNKKQCVRFLRAYCDSSNEEERVLRDIGYFAAYLVLKKLSLVNQPGQLHWSNRLALTSELLDIPFEVFV